jgi:hypothetical protein
LSCDYVTELLWWRWIVWVKRIGGSKRIRNPLCGWRIL